MLSPCSLSQAMKDVYGMSCFSTTKIRKEKKKWQHRANEVVGEHIFSCSDGSGDAASTTILVWTVKREYFDKP